MQRAGHATRLWISCASPGLWMSRQSNLKPIGTLPGLRRRLATSWGSSKSVNCATAHKQMDRRTKVKVSKVLKFGGRHDAKVRVFHNGTPHRFAECHHADKTDYFFAVFAGSALAGLAALAVLPFNSMTITSISLSPVF